MWVVLKCSIKYLCILVLISEQMVAAKIKRIMMKKIWRIPLFLLVIVTLGVSFVTIAVIYNKRVTSTPPVVLGTGHLIDGYHVVYDGNLKAKWTAQMFRLSSDGNLKVDLRCDYISENPTLSKIFYSQDNVSILEVDLEYETSIILLRIGSVYKLEPWGDFAHGDITEVVPIAPKFTDSKSCFIEYRGNFSLEVNVTKVMTEAYALEVKFSWIRVFREKNNGTFYYQWLQGDSDVWEGRKLEVDKTYNDLSGGFLVYYPIPESVTSPLLPLEFDYVKWIEENV